MKRKDEIKQYTIRNIINYRKLDWSISDDFLYLTDVPEIFEPFEMKPHYFAYGIINSGSITIEVDYQKFLIDERSLLIYRPEQNVKVIKIESGTKGMFVLFTKKFMDYLFESFFSIAPNSFLKNKFGSQVVLSKEDHSKMNTLFTRTLDFLVASEADNERWIYSAKSILLALINESDRLSGSSESISQIADHLQFTNLQSFSRYFKKQTGSSPTSFRKYNILTNP